MEETKKISRKTIIIVALILVLLIISFVIALKGFGKKVVAVKELEDTSIFYALGKYTNTIEAYYKNDKLVLFKETYTMKDESTANTLCVELISDTFLITYYHSDLIKITRDNNIVTVEYNVEKISDLLGTPTDKETLKENLQEQGYEVNESFYFDLFDKSKNFAENSEDNDDSEEITTNNKTSLTDDLNNIDDDESEEISIGGKTYENVADYLE